MMDRNTVLAIVLSAAVLLLWMALFPPQPPHPTPEPPGAAQPASKE